MATVIERERPVSDRNVIVERSDSGAGWAVAVIVLVAVLAVAAFAWVRYHGTAAPATTGASINVSLPSGSGDTSGGTGSIGGTGAAGY